MTTEEKLDKVLDKKFEAWKLSKLAELRLQESKLDDEMYKLNEKLEKVQDEILGFEDTLHFTEYHAENTDICRQKKISPYHQDLESVIHASS